MSNLLYDTMAKAMIKEMLLMLEIKWKKCPLDYLDGIGFANRRHFG